VKEPRLLERAFAAWLRFLTPTRIRVYPLVVLGVVLLIGSIDALYGLGEDSQKAVFGGDFLGFYSAGALVTSAPALLNDPGVQERFQQQLFAQNAGQVALWVSPPYFAWLFAPLARLPYFTAFAVFLTVSAGCLFAALHALRAELALTLSTPALVWLGLQYYPTLHWLLNGQLTALWLSVFVAVFILLRREREVAAGLLLGTLACKPTLALGLIIVLLSARRLRVLLAAGLGALCWLALGLLTLPDAMRGYVRGSAALVAFVRSHGYNTAGLHGSFEFGTLLLDDVSQRLASALGIAITLGLAGLVARLWWRTPWQPGTRAWDIRMAASLALGIILGPHLFVYDLMLLLLPFFILLRHFPVERGLPLAGGRLLGLVALTWTLGLLGPVLTVAQQEATRRVFGASCAIQLGVVAILLTALAIVREADPLQSTLDAPAN
jgi:hypothetical protein